MRTPDNRCCGSGVCIINDAGECWCGQVWDGAKMSAPPLLSKNTASSDSSSSSSSEKQDVKPD
jgi:hypothetical protein